MIRSGRHVSLSPRRKIWPFVAGLVAVLLLKSGDVFSSPEDKNPYFTSPDKIALMVVNGDFEASVTKSVWARPALPNLLTQSKGMPIENRVRLRLAELYDTQGLTQKAVSLYEELINQSKGGEHEAAGLFALQRLFYENGDYGRVVSSLELLEKYKTSPELPHARYLAGQAFMNLYTPLRAVSILERIGEKDLDGPFARYALGLAYAQQDRQASARNAFEESIKWASTRVSPRKVVQRNLKTGQTETRIVEAPLYPEERHELDSVLAKARLSLGYLLIQEKDYVKAEQIFADVAPESPYYPDALYGRAWAQIYGGQLVQAIVTLNKLIKGFPSGEHTQEALLLVGSCYVNLKVYDKAIRAYQEAIEAYNLERGYAHQLIEEPFLRERFEKVRLYFDPGFADDAGVDPMAGMSDAERQVFVRLVTSVDAREWFNRHVEVGHHLQSLRDAGFALTEEASLIESKIKELEGYEQRISEVLGERLSESEQQYELLDARINQQGDFIDVWQLASRKETERVQILNQQLLKLRRIERSFKRIQEQFPEGASGETGRLLEQVEQRIAKIKTAIENERGGIIWGILASANISGGKVKRSGTGGRSDAQQALLERELEKIKTLIERTKERVSEIKTELATTRARYRQLQIRVAQLNDRQTQALGETERYYLSLREKVIEAVGKIFQKYDNRLERFVAEAEFGVIGALDRQASR